VFVFRNLRPVGLSEKQETREKLGKNEMWKKSAVDP